MDILRDLSFGRLARLILAGLLLVFVTTRFAWAGRFFSVILNFPELRHEVLFSPSPGNNLSIVQIHVTNLGFGPAEKVVVHISTQGSRINSYEIDAQEIYELKTLDLGRGLINIWFDRLAPGAGAEIKLTGVNLTKDQVRVTAASNQGVSLPVEQQTLSAQVGEYAQSASNLFGKAWNTVARSKAVQELDRWAGGTFLYEIYQIVVREDFQTVAITLIMVVTLAGILLSDRLFALLLFLAVWFLTWIFFYDIKVPLNWISTPATLLTALGLGGLAISTQSEDEKWGYVFFAIVSLLVFIWSVFFGETINLSISWLVGIPVALFVISFFDWAGLSPRVPGNLGGQG